MSRFVPPSQAMSADEGTQAKVSVKWFNVSKGFGFVAPEDGNGDAFLHISVLNRAGMQQIGDGAVLSCLIAPGAKGRQVTRILDVLSEGSGNSGGESQSYARQDNHYNQRPSYDTHQRQSYDAPVVTGPEVEVTGTVKWFKPDKGFGFVAADDGDKDIFVHKSLLRRANINDLESGQRVKVRATVAAKGREATWIALSGE